MIIDVKIRDEKLQNDINREAAKISLFSSVKIDKYEYLTGKEILPPDQSRVIEQAKFTYPPLGKAFEKQIEIIEDQGKKEVGALKVLKPVEHLQNLQSIEEIFPKDLENSEIKNELNQIKKLEEEIDRNDLKYEAGKYEYNFQKFQPIRSFGDYIYNPKITISEDDKKYSNLLNIILDFNSKVRPRSKANKEKNQYLWKFKCSLWRLRINSQCF